jgi:transcriptional regulator with XRE-family HTH domain
MALLRRVLGETLRGQRLRQQRTLREVSSAARVSLGYLSEVERGQKEASSELLAAICDALELRLSDVLGEVSEGMRRAEQPATLDSAAMYANHHELSGLRRVPAVPRQASEPEATAETPVLEPAGAGGHASHDGAEAEAMVADVAPVPARRALEPAGGDSREVLDAVLRIGPGRVIAA